MNVRTWSRSLVAVAALVLGFAASSPALGQEKILRIPMTTNGPGTLDPVAGSTTYENRACSALYETLLEYKYLKRPLELQPLLLAEMPEVIDGGRLWKFRLLEGVRFHNDECFPGGVGRELKAEDVIYSWKRLADPENQYKSWWLVDQLIKGFDAYKDEQKQRVDDGEDFDFDADVEGLRVTGDYTFEIELNEANQQFVWRLGMFQFSIVPREAVEFYGSKFAAHPVGTGAFILKEESDWARNSSILFHKNPEYREAYYPTEWMPEDVDAGLTEAAGKRIPFVDKLLFTFYVESQPSWLEFKSGREDFSTVPSAGFQEAFSRRTKELRRSWKAKGIHSVKVPLLDFIFRQFNMEDEVLGGYTPEKKALRQAFNLAMDWDENNETFYFGMALPYDGPIPPGLDGHPNNEDHRAPFSTRGPNFALAREKLEEAGFTLVDGKIRKEDFPVIEFYTSAGAESQRITELMQRNLAEVGIRINPRYVNFTDLMNKVDRRQAPMFSFAWGSDYPDAENNLALFYGPNESPGSNHCNYKNPEYDRLYEMIRTMPPSPERTKIYEQMRDMLMVDAPFCGSMARTRVYLIQPWTKNFKPTEDFYSYIKYIDIDMDHPDRND
jgi:peptide/nickel transport system substrate-binding protein